MASEIAAFYNLGTVIEPTQEERPHIEQNQTSDWEFLKTLADRNRNLRALSRREEQAPFCHSK